MLKALLNAILGTHEPKPRTIHLIPERHDYLTPGRASMSPPPAKTFLMKTKALEQITAMILIEGVTAHMRRTANTLLSNRVAHTQGTDDQFNTLANNMLRLAAEIETFLNKKSGKGGEKPLKPIDRGNLP